MMDEKIKENSGSKTLKVYDPAMCCPTGICGTTIDSALVEFAGAVKTAARHGVVVERFNLAQQPQAFAQDERVKKDLAELGHTKLPFFYINDELKWSGRYPAAKELFSFLGMDENSDVLPGNENPSPFVAPGADSEGQAANECCPGGGCCS